MRSANLRQTTRARRLRRDATDVARRLWRRLSNRQLAGFKFVRQEPIGPYIADFVCRDQKLVVELDGSQHAENARDLVRDRFMHDRGYRVMRFWNAEVNTNLEGVLETIFAALHATTPENPLSPLAGRGLG